MRRRLIPLLGSLLLAGLPLRALASAGKAELGGIVSHRIERPRGTRDYWTPERVADAEGVPLLEGVAPPERGYVYPAPFTRFNQFPNPNKFPYRTVGKLVYRRNGLTYACTAAVIGDFAIWTAAHCLYGDGQWSEVVEFIPALKSGQMPYGKWSAVVSFVPGRWIQNQQDMAADFGGVILDRLNGLGIGQAVGRLGFAYNQGVTQHWFLFGYPGQPQPPFDGSRQVICAASQAYRDSRYSPQPIGVGCDQQQGSSGGPWVLGFGTSNLLNGNTSYARPTFSREIFSPYFGNAAKALYDCLFGSTPTSPGPAC